MTPESFVVQIYRPPVEGNPKVAGVVQRVGSGRRQSFSTPEELWTLLVAPSDEKKGISRDPAPR